MSESICHVCDLPVDDDERHDDHEPWCGTLEGGTCDCACFLPAHPACCQTCAATELANDMTMRDQHAGAALMSAVWVLAQVYKSVSAGHMRAIWMRIVHDAGIEDDVGAALEAQGLDWGHVDVGQLHREDWLPAMQDLEANNELRLTPLPKKSRRRKPAPAAGLKPADEAILRLAVDYAQPGEDQAVAFFPSDGTVSVVISGENAADAPPIDADTSD